jgi:cholesterol transport system auxiliary component
MIRPTPQKKYTHLTCSTYIAAILAWCLLTGCSSLLPSDVTQPKLYSFDSAKPAAQHVQTVKAGAPSLIVGISRAAAGFDSQQMVYVRQPYKLEYFRENQWVNEPAIMLLPLVATALEESGTFSAVLQSPTSIPGQFRLELEIIRLQQEFTSIPSGEHFTLRAHLLSPSTRQVVAWREFDSTVPAPSDDPYGGVMAANQAVQQVIAQLVTFCSEAVSRLPQTKP